MPYFKGVPRQRGRGFGAFAGTVVRSAFPILKKYVIPVAKQIGRDVIEAAVPEIGNIISGKSNLKRALKETGRKTLKKQIGGGAPKKRRRKTSKKKKTKVKSKKIKARKQKSKRIYTKSKIQNSRQDIFKNLR